MLALLLYNWPWYNKAVSAAAATQEYTASLFRRGGRGQTGPVKRSTRLGEIALPFLVDVAEPRRWERGK